MKKVLVIMLVVIVAVSSAACTISVSPPPDSDSGYDEDWNGDEDWIKNIRTISDDDYDWSKFNFDDYKDIVTDTPFKLGDKIKFSYNNDDYGYTPSELEEINSSYRQLYGSYPYIDGSTVCIPMAIEFAMQHLDLPQEYATLFCYSFSKTATAYVNLIEKRSAYDVYLPNGAFTEISMIIDRPVDLFLGTEPSDDELALAKKNNVELVKKPVCMDAFIFVVNKDNPVDSLTVEQIRDIYSGKITNWKEVGGNDEKIISFQREKNSGSQTAMENLVMKGTPMVSPQKEEIETAMGELIESVADFDSGKASIGYSYLY
ncbi:MAG: substrate-binding domain-containing protein, partial [Clostridiales Family XIII bacterium]|nr:substrate-binding domain-containing protein [Clostridiales Family XIII bacterium]